jgi:hypothetical protein
MKMKSIVESVYYSCACRRSVSVFDSRSTRATFSCVRIIPCLAPILIYLIFRKFINQFCVFCAEFTYMVENVPAINAAVLIYDPQLY